MSKKYSKNSKGKRVGKTIAMFLAGLLLGMGLVTAIGGLTSGYDNMNPTTWFEKEPNPDNLIKVDDNYIVTQDTNRGVKIKVNENNGEIKLTGTATSAHEVTVQTVSLKPGTYKLSGMKNVNLDKCYLGCVVNGVAYKANVADNDTFTVSEVTDVRLYISWVDKHDFGLFGMKVLPELVAVTAESK